jgi:hypothetical protein
LFVLILINQYLVVSICIAFVIFGIFAWGRFGTERSVPWRDTGGTEMNGCQNLARPFFGVHHKLMMVESRTARSAPPLPYTKTPILPFFLPQ